MNRSYYRASLQVGIHDSEHKIYKDINGFTSNLKKDPVLKKYLPRIRKGMYKTALGMRKNYNSSNKMLIFSTRKMENDSHKKAQAISHTNDFIPTKKTKFGRVSELGANQIGRLGKIGDLKNNIYNRIFYTQSLSHLNQFSSSQLKSVSHGIRDNMGKNRYQKELKNISPQANDIYRESLINKKLNQHQAKAKWDVKEHKELSKRKVNEDKKFSQLRNGKLYKPILNAKQIRNKASHAKANLSGSKKAKMTRLINLTHHNPYLHRFASKWSQKNYPNAVHTQRVMNYLHDYIKENPDQSFRKKEHLLYNPRGQKHFFGDDINYAYKNVKWFYKHHPLNKWHQKAQNIEDSRFYTNQLKHVDKAKRDFKQHQKTGKYIVGDPHPKSVKDVYVSQRHTYGFKSFNVNASSKNWTKMKDLKTMADFSNKQDKIADKVRKSTLQKNVFTQRGLDAFNPQVTSHKNVNHQSVNGRRAIVKKNHGLHR